MFGFFVIFSDNFFSGDIIFSWQTQSGAKDVDDAIKQYYAHVVNGVSRYNVTMLQMSDRITLLSIPTKNLFKVQF